MKSLEITMYFQYISSNIKSSLPNVNLLTSATLCVLTVCLVFRIIHSLWFQKGDGRRRPPGPKGLPLIGSLLDLRYDVLMKLKQFAQEYGSIYTINLGPTRLVVLNDKDSIKEAFVTKAADMSDRPQAMLDTLQQTRDLMLGEVPDSNSEEVKKLLDVLYKTLSPNPMLVLAGKVIPTWLKSALSDWIDMSDYLSKVTHYLKEHIQEHRKTYEGDPQNLIDAFLLKEQQELDKYNRLRKDDIGSSSSNSGGKSDQEPPETSPRVTSVMVNDQEENEKNLAAILMDVFQAGCTSIVASLQWLLLDLAFNQDVQEKMRKEIDGYVEERNQRPSLLIRSDNFHYTKAVMLESLRLHPPAPLGAPHCAARDTKLGGFHIDKGTIILSNLLNALQDSKQWKDAGDFRPERFLNEDGTLETRDTLGFSTGPRLCPGKLLTNTVISSILTEIIQDFTFHLPPDHKHSLKGIPGIVYNPQPFSIIAKQRQR
ncbi:cytochrome P450 2A1-like isoform X2 [Lytechinus variegatus]|uniref:cytochrome P450 2A1-like isoform X2 n=1 Tax=Lytechinus variegatus TaxID=7654 RepID=UPI001BB1E69C|nr:cytochrome P450 2A1-like isoform X2 [Lytechinus variegatus]